MELLTNTVEFVKVASWGFLALLIVFALFLLSVISDVGLSVPNIFLSKKKKYERLFRSCELWRNAGILSQDSYDLISYNVSSGLFRNPKEMNDFVMDRLEYDTKMECGDVKDPFKEFYNKITEENNKAL